jgi:chemotaxis protein MotB
MAASCALLACVLTAGCGPDAKTQKIGQLQDENRNLLDEVGRAKADADAARKELEFLRQQADAARREAEALRGELSKKPEETAPPGWVSVPGGAMIAIDDSVLFQSGKAVLRPEARKTLDAVAGTIQGQYGSKDVLVYGHTDDQPIKKSGFEDNWQLSTQRALVVVRYLKERGIDPKRLVAAGVGEFRPRAPNSGDAGRSKNRRVEIFALDASVKNAPHE